MRHARTHNIQLSGPTVHSLYCALDQTLDPRTGGCGQIRSESGLAKNVHTYIITLGPFIREKISRVLIKSRLIQDANTVV